MNFFLNSQYRILYNKYNFIIVLADSLFVLTRIEQMFTVKYLLIVKGEKPIHHKVMYIIYYYTLYVAKKK